jgi:cytochrome c551
MISGNWNVNMSLSRSIIFVWGLFAVVFFSCQQSSTKDTPQTSAENETAKPEPTTKFAQYYVKGENLYLAHCSNCHQKNGAGLGLLFPPLNKSDYLDQNKHDVICLIRHGKKGEIIVNGKMYNKEMKGIPSLTDLEIAEIATYLYNSWDRNQGIIEVKDVTSVLSTCEPK